ncbi:YiiX/YebB-like N1pC/P60 family cysteine hydrolase [Haloferula sp. A504]|uniref:YiiX/YebB-like N1pC/P60 family cysteine hydrolase n=1 Tax=Haloferula sp. A504 TaxID=3373601 RepID=UPI0031C4DEBE|nr:hypothetical protein [Verrucomicrobiaceae bacterium E54]
MTTPHPDDPKVARAAAAVLAAADSFEGAPASPEVLAAAGARGYFTPGEDERIRVRYRSFLAGRAALLEALASMEESCGSKENQWLERLPSFVVALAAATVLLRGARETIETALTSRLLRKKLDEADPCRGIPRKTFTLIYRAATRPRRLLQFHDALALYRAHHDEIHAGAGTGRYGELVDRLDGWIAAIPPLSGSKIFSDRVRYRWFSFRRRHHSAWKRAVFGVFEDAGCRIADLRQPGHRPGPKKVTAELREAALKLARPGDVFITRHDDALSNLFLPGFWPHAAFHVGSEAQRREMGIELPAEAGDPACFLEAKKDGVRFRPAGETLAVDRFVILRPPLEPAAIAGALERAARHAGKLYDFVFDFRKSDRLVCTEVVYRAYHGEGGLEFRLIESGGRLCLPAEALIDQALEQGFRIVATANLGGGGLLTGAAAETALHGARAGL